MILSYFSERESSSNVDNSIEMMLKKLRSNVEKPQTKDKDECLKENSDNGSVKGAKKINGKIHVNKNGPLPKNNPLVGLICNITNAVISSYFLIYSHICQRVDKLSTYD
jgi:hypothetical protein